MLQEPRLPAAQAVWTQGKQTRKQEALIRGRALAIPVEISYELQSHGRLSFRLSAAALPRQGTASGNQVLLQAASGSERSQRHAMISEFPSIRAQRGPGRRPDESHRRKGRTC